MSIIVLVTISFKFYELHPSLEINFSFINLSFACWPQVLAHTVVSVAGSDYNVGGWWFAGGGL